MFFKQLESYSEINSTIPETAIKKMASHLWFLSPETSALAFFDEAVPVDI